MHAAWYEEFGTARDVLTLGKRETPRPGPGEVLVRLRASGVNPSDVKKRAGSFPDLLDDGYIIPNSDGAGVVEAVGDGVDPSRIGDRVWVYQAQYGRRFGTAAQYVAIADGLAPPLPGNAGFDVGACLGIPAMTAHRAVFADGNVDGQTIVVTGGAGRVGYYAVQWASRAGANVIATASNAVDEQACRDAGASQVVDHRSESFAADILGANNGEPVDRVIDVEFGANLPVSVDVLRVGGVIATYASMQEPEPRLPFFRMMYKDLTIRMIIVYAMPEDAKRLAIADIDKALRNDALRHRIAHTLSLDDIATANEIVEQGDIRGAVILTID